MAEQDTTEPNIQLPNTRRQSRMLEPAVLLLLLERDGAYGYDLSDRIENLGLTDADIEPSAVYRCLRWLEEQGQVRSRWDTSGSGHPKRRYELTQLGLKTLSLWADLIRRRQRGLQDYLARYRDAVKQASYRLQT